ncbi:acyltransferase [Rhodoblastus acidophilus]|uniref:Acyltransferase n=1 Tax=Candidatus Rhodoblastus alkanivorans TaxID=2954117 RepID=A0ABS9ZBB2_9HYPH|nr:acyltransferase [Candidatus Rhodoblastus alkanivorans]MCI4679345.1 acyltransferase [Candidatus Rhodoblastus alkanivorans]MCI4684821.1 acyltransferase [Candidatus Rhodoblastus alkanivorans]MDI4642145.1 acyltransferase [Rhodoblastus acidophilus]
MRFRALDGLRGLSALTVALVHLYESMKVTPPEFIGHAYALVDFFFVLSGFVLAHAFFDKLAVQGDGWAFALRRFGRMYPLHFFMLSLLVAVEAAKWVAARHGVPVLVQPFTAENSIPALFSNLLLIQSLGLHDRLTWNFPAWSISVEFYVNMLFCMVMVLPWRGAESREGVQRRKTWIIAALAVFGCVATLLATRYSTAMSYDYGFVRCIYGFFCGVLAQRIRAGGLDPFARLSDRAVAASEVALTVVAIAFVTFSPWFWLFALTPLLFTATTLVYAHQKGPFSRLLLTPPLHAIGEWSYSIYLVHTFLLIHILGRFASFAGKHGWIGLHPVAGADGGAYIGGLYHQGPLMMGAVVAVYVGLILAMSSLTFRFIEKPAHRYFNAMAARREARPEDEESDIRARRQAVAARRVQAAE